MAASADTNPNCALCHAVLFCGPRPPDRRTRATFTYPERWRASTIWTIARTRSRSVTTTTTATARATPPPPTQPIRRRRRGRSRDTEATCGSRRRSRRSKARGRCLGQGRRGCARGAGRGVGRRLLRRAALVPDDAGDAGRDLRRRRVGAADVRGGVRGRAREPAQAQRRPADEVAGVPPSEVEVTADGVARYTTPIAALDARVNSTATRRRRFPCVPERAPRRRNENVGAYHRRREEATGKKTAFGMCHLIPASVAGADGARCGNFEAVYPRSVGGQLAKRGERERRERSQLVRYGAYAAVGGATALAVVALAPFALRAMRTGSTKGASATAGFQRVGGAAGDAGAAVGSFKLGGVRAADDVVKQRAAATQLQKLARGRAARVAAASNLDNSVSADLKRFAAATTEANEAKAVLKATDETLLKYADEVEEANKVFKATFLENSTDVFKTVDDQKMLRKAQADDWHTFAIGTENVDEAVDHLHAVKGVPMDQARRFFELSEEVVKKSDKTRTALTKGAEQTAIMIDQAEELQKLRRGGGGLKYTKDPSDPFVQLGNYAQSRMLVAKAADDLDRARKSATTARHITTNLARAVGPQHARHISNPTARWFTHTGARAEIGARDRGADGRARHRAHVARGGRAGDRDERRRRGDRARQADRGRARQDVRRRAPLRRARRADRDPVGRDVATRRGSSSRRVRNGFDAAERATMARAAASLAGGEFRAMFEASADRDDARGQK